MERRVRHLDGVERAVTFAEHGLGTRQREIGRLLGRSARTVCRLLTLGRVSHGRGPGELAVPSSRNH